MKCRHCATPLTLPLVDLGSAPPSNAYLTEAKLKAPEKWYPLRVLVCEQCWLVQTEDFARADELFDAEYAYFSSYSSSWLEHSRRYVAYMTQRLGLGAGSQVIEVAANDGYLLQYFQQAGIPCTGIEPTASTATAARDKGIPIIEAFFGKALAEDLLAQGKQADLMLGNNVLAHVPDINDFVTGFTTLLKPQGVVTFEFPHLLNLMTYNQFDTIYHEHYSYLSLTAVTRIFAANGLTVFDVEELPTHGGSLRVFAQRSDTGKQALSGATTALLAREVDAGMTRAEYYAGFQDRADKIKNDFLTFLLKVRNEDQTVAAYGAAAKGNTLMNYAGVRPDLLHFVVDKNSAKQNKFMPGSRIPILDEPQLRQARPDYIVILPWNLKDEVVNQLSYVNEWGGRFLTAVPKLEVI